MQASSNPSKASCNRTRATCINFALLLSGVVMSLSGLVIQYHYHLLKKPAHSVAAGLEQGQWNAVHVWSALIFVLCAAGHIREHRRWYGSVLKRPIHPKQRPTVVLTFLTMAVTLSGVIPLFLSTPIRLSIIEIHDKIALLFFVVALRHVIKRRGWYSHKNIRTH